MEMLDELEHRLTEGFNLWEGGRLLQVAASGRDDEALVEFDRLVSRSAEDVRRFAGVMKRV